MSRYWVIAPFESRNRSLFNKVWQVDLANNVISIGWIKLGDVSQMNRDVLLKAIKAKYPKKAAGLVANMLLTFYHEIRPGDFVIARKGQMILAAIGKVVRKAKYTDEKNPLLEIPEADHLNLLEVEWQEQPRGRGYRTIVFPRPTICELSKCTGLSEDQRRRIQDECVGSVNLPNEAAAPNDGPPEGDRRRLIERQIRERRGQQQFREALCKRYGSRCLVTGCEVLAVLEAAHIKPYRGEEDNHPGNGLLLRADIHTLFDLNLIGIEPEQLRLELHPDLAEDEVYVKLAGKALRCTRDRRPSADSLKRRYEEFQGTENKGQS